MAAVTMARMFVVAFMIVVIVVLVAVALVCIMIVGVVLMPIAFVLAMLIALVLAVVMARMIFVIVAVMIVMVGAGATGWSRKVYPSSFGCGDRARYRCGMNSDANTRRNASELVMRVLKSAVPPTTRCNCPIIPEWDESA